MKPSWPSHNSMLLILSIIASTLCIEAVGAGWPSIRESNLSDLTQFLDDPPPINTDPSIWPLSGESGIFSLAARPRVNTVFAEESNVFSLNDQAAGSGWVSGVRAHQRPGTELVEITYDAFGAGGGALNVTVSVSDDSGATYDVVATHFSGSGYGDNVYAEEGLLIIWNAAGDYDHRRSSKMRVKVAISGDHGDQDLRSNIFELDTRSIVTGTIEGRVLGDGSPLGGAEVRVEGSSYVAESIADGAFSLPGVPVGNGYVLTAGMAGYSGKRITNIDVEQGSNDQEDINLFKVSSPYRVRPLVPDVNPSTLEIEEGGTGYCYYRVVSADGYLVGLSPVSIRIKGGGLISQIGDVSDRWAGRTAGLSDANGIVRLRIPSSVIGSSGTSRTLEIVESGLVKQPLKVKVVARKYDHVWKHSAGVGASGKIAIFRAGASGLYESILRRTIVDDNPVAETITRRKVAELRGGVEVGAAVKVSSGGAKARAGAGVYVSLEAAETCSFNPQSEDLAENSIKLYMALGNAMYLAPPAISKLYGMLDSAYSDVLLEDYLVGVETSLRLGAYAEADASIGILEDSVALGAEAKLSGEAEGIMGYEEHYAPDSEYAYVLGVAARGESSAGARAAFSDVASASASAFAYGDIEFKGKLWRKPEADRPHRVSIEQVVSAGAGASAGAGVSLWGSSIATNVSAECHKQFREEFNFNLSSDQSVNRLNAAASVWDTLKGDGGGSVVSISQPAAMLTSVLQLAAGDGSAVDYERSVYAAYQKSVGMELDFDIAAIAIGLKLEGSAERGAEVVSERGKLWQFLRMARESYPELGSNHIPDESFFDIEKQWIVNVASGFDDLWDSVTDAVIGFFTGDAIQTYGVQATDEGTVLTCTVSHENLSLTVAEGVLPAGTHINMSSIFVVPTNTSPVAYEGFLPQIGSSNWVYGIGGIYQLEGDQPFSSNGTLTISYGDFEVAGLPEEQLRIYRIADHSDEWALIGGVVDTTNNFVSCSINQFGTYAVAPPLPVGDLVFNLSTNSLPSDGLSQLSIVVSNMVLNTQQIATEPWMFDMLALGVDVLNPDANTNLYGHQIIATNGILNILLQAPNGGTDAQLSLLSRAGNAQGTIGIPLFDDDAPEAPQGVSASAGQSRIWVSWATNSEPDVVRNNVYYRQGQAGPPYDGVANVEGFESPVKAAGTNCLLRGLSMGQSYYIAVSSVDSSGNESPLVSIGEVTTTEQPPHPPQSVAVRFGEDGTNVLMWALSEDDGYNDRDVVRYDIYRAVMPGGSFAKVSEVSAGIGLFTEESPSITSNQYVRYAIESIDSLAGGSGQALADNFLEDGAVDNDRDGMGDLWEDQYGLDSQNPLDWWQDHDSDGLTNIDEYRNSTNPYSDDSDGDRVRDADELIAGTNPADPNSVFQILNTWKDGDIFVVDWTAVPGRAYAVLWTPNLNQEFELLDTGILYPACSYTDTVHSAGSKGFYRVDVKRLDETDNDGDWLPNDWEMQFFGNPTGAVAFADSDGDGLSNIDEYKSGTNPLVADSDGDKMLDADEVVAGTSPTNSASVFKVLLDHHVVNDSPRYVIKWTAVPGRAYAVLWTPSLAEDFKLLDTGILYPGCSYTDTVHSVSSKGFYRVVVKRLDEADSDGDWLPNDWERQYAVADAFADGDNDGFNNLAEFIAGTDPTNGTSFFTAASTVAEVNGTNCFVVEWISIPDRLYSVQWSTNLVAGFQTLETGIEHPQDAYTDTVHSAESAGYYKVDVRLK